MENSKLKECQVNVYCETRTAHLTAVFHKTP